jgi:hypothetical protein
LVLVCFVDWLTVICAFCCDLGIFSAAGVPPRKNSNAKVLVWQKLNYRQFKTVGNALAVPTSLGMQ